MSSRNNAKLVIVRRVLRRRRTFFHVPKSLYQVMKATNYSEMLNTSMKNVSINMHTYLHESIQTNEFDLVFFVCSQHSNTVDVAPQPSSQQPGNQNDTLSTQRIVQPVTAPMVIADVREINTSDSFPLSQDNSSDIVAHTDPFFAQTNDGNTREVTFLPDGTNVVKREPESTENIHYEQSSYAQNDMAAILATLNTLTEEVRELRTEVGEITKKLDKLHQARSNVRQVDKTQPRIMDFTFINTVSEASELEKDLEDEEFEEQLVCFGV